MRQPNVVMLSLWRNDADRDLQARAEHLLEKSYPGLRWVWVVGDCSDDTFARLSQIVDNSGKVVEILYIDTGLTVWEGDHRELTPVDWLRLLREEKFERLAASVNAGLDQVRPDDDYVLFHESDLLSPVDVVERLLATGKCPVAGWPVLPVHAGVKIFYDTWAYRKFRERFSNYWPYHPGYRQHQVFEVDSVGSVWLMHAEDIRAGLRMDYQVCVGLCRRLRERGRRIWVDPDIEIVQPKALWSPQVAMPF